MMEPLDATAMFSTPTTIDWVFASAADALSPLLQALMATIAERAKTAAARFLRAV
jgi:hypothetical protein